MTISAAARGDLQGWQEYIEMYVSSLHADDPTKTCEWIEPKLIHVISQMCQSET
jgi:hypothetical protein